MEKLYVFFLATPYRMGRMIRAVTRQKFNHVALSFTPEGDELYSFARTFRDLPLCGAFVKETPERYLWEPEETVVKVAAVPMTEAQKRKLVHTLRYFEEHAADSVYNHFAALLEPFGKTVQLRGAYTCVQFVQGVFGHYFPELGIDPVAHFTITDLEDALAPYVVYEGAYPGREEKCRYGYYTPHGRPEQVLRTARVAATLFDRLFEKGLKKL